MSKLTDIAAYMRNAATSGGEKRAWVRTLLPGGLDMILEHHDGQMRLALRRPGVYPSDTELRLCAEAFGVAADSEPARRTKTEGRGPYRTTYHIVEYRWREIAPVELSTSPLNQSRFN